MHNLWLQSSIILLAMLAIFGIIGSMEGLPADAEYKLELARQGKNTNLTIAKGY